MSLHLQREMDRLNLRLRTLADMVEQQVERAVQALLDRDHQQADFVEQRDQEVDKQEVELEEECLKLLALYQPVARDLRLIVSTLKVNNDLERIGDMAVNIARKARTLAAEPPLAIPFDLRQMWRYTQQMLHRSLRALLLMDGNIAREVIAADDEVDRLKREVRETVEKSILRQPERTKAWLALLAVSRNLERIADCATSIAKDSLYLSEGTIIRHS